MLIGVASGNPLRFTTNVAVAEMIFPEESFVAFRVMVAVPLPADSGPVTGGVSSDGRSAAVNVCMPLPEGVAGMAGMAGGSEPPPAQTIPSDTTKTNEVTYFIFSTPVIESDCQKNLRLRLKPRYSPWGTPPCDNWR